MLSILLPIVGFVVFALAIFITFLIARKIYNPEYERLIKN